MYRNTTVGSLPLGLSRRLLAQCFSPLRLRVGRLQPWRCLAACRFKPRAPAAAASREPSPIQRRGVAKAQVTATNTDTGVATTGHDHSSGISMLSATLQPGTYNVEVVAKGFQRLLQENVTVDNDSIFGLNLKLTVGGETTTITVTDAPPYLNTTDATLGGTIENELYSQLPLSMNGGPRDPTAFQYLMPGVQENPANNNQPGANTETRVSTEAPARPTSTRTTSRACRYPTSRSKAAALRSPMRFRSMRSISSPCRPAAPPPRSAAPGHQLHHQVRRQPVPRHRLRLRSQHRVRHLGLLLQGALIHRHCGKAGRAPEPLRRFRGRSHLQGQALLLRQLRGLPLHQDQQYAPVHHHSHHG